MEHGSKYLGMDAILGKNWLNHIATTLVVVPTMIIAATVPDSFSIATDIAVSVHDNMWHHRFLR
jgi:tyrosine-specific transport protein